ncbi:MAG: radical SAM protein [Candidatus Sabulitectum sp.]|nr:radical SAM protein [Candidatus Sabulitectum sp.]
MKITALNPPFIPHFSRGQRSPAVTRSGTLYFPIWLSYAVGALEQAGHTVQFIDSPAMDLDLAEVREKIREFSPDIIVLDTSTPSILSDTETADTLTDTGAAVFILGSHPSALPEETVLLGRKFRGAILGEYEKPLLSVVNALQDDLPLEGIPGTAIRRRDGAGVVVTPPQGYLTDLDSLPFVSSVYAAHLPVARYNNPNALHPQVMVMGGRGCPNQCSFCVFPQTLTGRHYRSRSVQNVVAEMKWVEDNMPEVQAVFFEDDTIAADMERLRLLSAEIIKAEVKISWTCNMRATADFQTLCQCHAAGLRSVCVGFESGCDEILDSMRKGLKVEQMVRFMESARKAGILVHGCFLFGIPGETRDTARRTLDFALKLNPDTAQFYPLMVYPGTDAYTDVQKAGLLVTSSWRDWLKADGTHACVVQTPDMSPDELVEFCNHARRKFYLRPGYIMKKVWRSLFDKGERHRTLLAFRTFRKYIFRRKND